MYLCIEDISSNSQFIRLKHRFEDLVTSLQHQNLFPRHIDDKAFELTLGVRVLARTFKTIAVSFGKFKVQFTPFQVTGFNDAFNLIQHHHEYFPDLEIGELFAEDLAFGRKLALAQLVLDSLPHVLDRFGLFLDRQTFEWIHLGDPIRYEFGSNNAEAIKQVKHLRGRFNQDATETILENCFVPGPIDALSYDKFTTFCKFVSIVYHMYFVTPGVFFPLKYFPAKLLTL